MQYAREFNSTQSLRNTRVRYSGLRAPYRTRLDVSYGQMATFAAQPGDIVSITNPKAAKFLKQV